MERRKKCQILFAIMLFAGFSQIEANNSSVILNPTTSLSFANATSISSSISSKIVTPSPVPVDTCSGKHFWSDDLVDISCGTVLCAKRIFPLFNKYMKCNKATTKKDVLSIAAKVIEYAPKLAGSVTSMLPSSVLGNGSMTFVTEKFVVEAGYMNRDKSDLREWTVVPNFAQGNFPSYTGQRDKFTISKLILGSGFSKYFTVFFKDIYSTSDVFNFNEAKSSSVIKMENIGAYYVPARSGKWVINSQIVHLEIDPSPAFTDFTEITFIHKELSHRINHKCVHFRGTYGNPSSSWNTAGCHTYFSDRFKTVCRCNAIGGFAVVSQVEEKAVSAKGFSRSFFTQIALGISAFIILGLICCMINPLIAGCFHLERVRITFSHDFAYFMVYACFLVGVIVSENTSHADTVAGCLHFFLTAVMSWFLVEGIHNYHSINAVYDPEVTSPIFFYSTIGWGIPAAFSGACAGYPYKLEVSEFSWMKVTGKDTAYFLAGPIFSVLGVLLLYALIFYELSSWIGSRQDSIYRRSVEYMKRSLAMMILAILTWYSGIMAINRKSSLGFHYFFLALYSCQGGAIIYMHLLKNTEISDYRAMKKYHESSNASSSTTTEEDLASLQSSMQFSKFDIRRSNSHLKSVKEEEQDDVASNNDNSGIKVNSEDHANDDDADTDSSNSDAEGFREEDFQDNDSVGYGRKEYQDIEEDNSFHDDEDKDESTRNSVDGVGSRMEEAERDKYSLGEADRISRNTPEEAGRLSRNTENTGRFSHNTEEAGRFSRYTDKAGSFIRETEEAGRISRNTEDAGRFSRKNEESGSFVRDTEEAGRISRNSEIAGRLSRNNEESGSFVRETEGAGRISRNTEIAGRFSHNNDEAGSFIRENEEAGRISRNNTEEGDAEE